MIIGHSPVTPIEGYQVSDTDTTGPYYGYVDKDQNYYIMKESTSGTVTSYRFWKGSNNYASDWADRINKTYDYFYNVFK